MLKKILLGFAVFFVVTQFIRPAKNLSAAGGPNEIGVKYAVPASVQSTLQHACYDCHSNRTNYPWYAEVQPLGWWLAYHVNDGKQHLNFSEFSTYTAKRAANKLDEISDAVTQHAMPLPSYTWGHPEARLTPAEIKQLTDWADNLHDEIAAD